MVNLEVAISVRNAPCESALMIHLCCNVSAEKFKYLSPSAVFSIPTLMAPNDEIFAAQEV